MQCRRCRLFAPVVLGAWFLLSPSAATAQGGRECFASGPTPPWAPFPIGTVGASAARAVPGARNTFELCSQSAGYGAASDSFLLLFQLMRAHWRIDARLDRIEPTGCAGLDARVHLGSSLLDDHPYVGIWVRRLATGGLSLQSSVRTEFGGRATGGGVDPLAVQLPVYLRIERIPDGMSTTILTSFSRDGRTYSPHLRVNATGTALDSLLFRVGMKQASEGDLTAAAVFSEAAGLVVEDMRPPKITRVEPNIGPVSGGTTLRIIGERLGDTTEVEIGGLRAEILRIGEDFVDARTRGAETAMSADVVVRTPRGEQVLPGGFTRIGFPFIRADCNGDGNFDISDAIAKLAFLFLGGPPCQCFDAADDNADGRCDVSDAVYGLGHLFLGSPAPPAPFPRAGVPDGAHVPCRLPAMPLVRELVMPAGQRALREGDLFSLLGTGFPSDPSQIMVFLGSTPAEVLDTSRTRLTARMGLVSQDLRAAQVSIFVDIGDFTIRSCAPTRCLLRVPIGNLSDILVDLLQSENVRPFGTSRVTGNIASIPFDASNLEPGGIIGVMGSIVLPPVAGEGGLSRGSLVLNRQVRPGSTRKSPLQLGEDIAMLIQEDLTGGGDPREVEVRFDPQTRSIVMRFNSSLFEFLDRQAIEPGINISIYGLGRPLPCTCTADLDEDGVDENYTPLVDARGYAWCRLFQLWKACNGLPTWEYFFPRNCVYIESSSTCESDGANTYPVFPLPHPHTIAPGVKSAMFNRSAYCHIRFNALWNLCKLRDLELMGDTQVPHFPRDAVVVKTEWSTNPPGANSLYYSYPYDNGSTTVTQYLTAWHFTDKCIDNWTWCDLYIDSSDGGNGGCGGMNADRPSALDGLGLDNYRMCVNVRITDSDTVCGNNFFPECNVSNCMACHHPDGAGGFPGADNAWQNSIGGGALGSDFLYSLTTGPAVPTGGPSDGDHPSCNN
jgi:hypothetical protein